MQCSSWDKLEWTLGGSIPKGCIINSCLPPSPVVTTTDQTAPSLLFSSISLLTCSIPTCTSTSLPTPFLHPSSRPSISPFTLSCILCLALFTSSTCALVSTSSFSIPLSISSSCELPISHAFFPNLSRSARFCRRVLRYVEEVYAF